MGYWKKRFEGGFTKVGQEAIDHQLRAKIDGLAAEIGKFRAAGDYTASAYAKTSIVTYIKDTFGISVSLRSPLEIGIGDEFPFAAIQPPQLDKNHPLIPNYRRVVASSTDLLQYTKFTRNRAVLGFVDRANAKIVGAIGDVLCPLYIGAGMLKIRGKADDFTDIEIAAIVGHELGHVFTYFEKLTSSLVNNMVATAAANKMMGLDSPKERLGVVSELEKFTGKDFEDKDTIIGASGKEEIYVHVVVELEKHIANDMGSEAYAVRTWERLADDFSARLGCGAELASALVKVQKHDPLGWFVTRSFMPMSLHVGIEVCWMVGILGTIVASPIYAATLIFVAYLAADPSGDIYDRPKERFVAIRQTMIDELKFVTKGDAHRRILEDIERLDAMTAHVKDKETIMEMVHNYVTPSGRKNHKAIEFHKELENYVFNDLYVAAATHKL